WPAGLLELGRARQLAGDLPGAVAAYRRHLAVSSQSPDGSIRLARALLEQGQAKAARQGLQLGRLDAPRDPRFPVSLGLSWIPERGPGNPKEAMDYFREALAIAPDHPLPHYYMGRLLAAQGRGMEAQAHLLKASEAAPTYPDPQLSYARAVEKAGARAEAKRQ